MFFTDCTPETYTRATLLLLNNVASSIDSFEEIQPEDISSVPRSSSPPALLCTQRLQGTAAAFGTALTACSWFLAGKKRETCQVLHFQDFTFLSHCKAGWVLKDTFHAAGVW